MVEQTVQESNSSATTTFRGVLDAETIKRTVDVAHAVFDECHLYVDPDGLRLAAIDAATVVRADVTLERTAFESFEGAPDHLGIDLERLRNVVGIADRDQLVALEVNAESRTLSIRIDELEYTLALLDPETIRSPREGSSDAFDLAGAVVASAETFDRSVRAAEMVSTHLEFELDAADEVFEVRADGDTDDVSLTLSAADLVDLEPADAVSLFSVDYLASINRAMPGGVDVGLGLGTEKPLSIRYEFADGGGDVEYLVAPRISAT